MDPYDYLALDEGDYESAGDRHLASIYSEHGADDILENDIYRRRYENGDEYAWARQPDGSNFPLAELEDRRDHENNYFLGDNAGWYGNYPDHYFDNHERGLGGFGDFGPGGYLGDSVRIPQELVQAQAQTYVPFQSMGGLGGYEGTQEYPRFGVAGASQDLQDSWADARPRHMRYNETQELAVRGYEDDRMGYGGGGGGGLFYDEYGEMDLFRGNPYQGEGGGGMYGADDMYGGEDMYGAEDLYGGGADMYGGGDGMYGGGGDPYGRENIADETLFDPMSRYADLR